VPKQLSTGDRTILGSISKRGNRYLRSLFVQAAWVVLVKIGPKRWDRYGLLFILEIRDIVILLVGYSCGVVPLLR
jgi:transposase